MSDPHAGNAKRALVIGIDRYPPQLNPLDGCVNDATAFRDLLLERFFVPDGNIEFLRDGEATRTAILDGFDRLIEKSAPGDMVVIYYAGHGSRVRDVDGDESEGYDSTIVPVDAIRWSTLDDVAEDPEIRDITDDEIQIKLLRLSERTDNITLIFDCCHSGTVSRGPSDSKARSLPELPGRFRRPAQSPEDRAFAERLDRTRRSGSGWWAPEDRYVLIAGCRDSEQSYETDDFPKHGRLTFHLVRALQQARPGTTFRGVFESVAEKVVSWGQATGKPQHPQLEGAADRLLFQTAEIERLSYVRAEPLADGRVRLAGGAARGLTPGSTWAVIPVGGTREDARRPLATVRIGDVRALESFATVEPANDAAAGPAEIPSEAWAVETGRDFGDLRMKVQVTGDRLAAPAAWDTLVEGLSEHGGVLDLVEDGSGAVRVVLVPAGRGTDVAPSLLPDPTVRWAVVSETGHLMMPPKPATTLGGVQVVGNLQLWAQYRYKLAIENPTGTLASTVRVEVVRRDADGAWKEPERPAGEPLPVVREGDVVDIRLHNDGDEPVYVHAFDFRMTGEVTALLPKGFWLEPTRGTAHSISGGRGSQPLTWEEGFPFSPNPWSEPRDEGVETYKFFLTSEETDLMALAQRSGSRGAGPESGNPLEALVASAQRGTRGTAFVTPDEWATVSYPLVLRRRADTDLDDGREHRVASVRVQAASAGTRVRPGGTVSIQGIERRPEWRQDTPAARMDALFDRMGLRRMESLTVGGSGGGRGGPVTVRTSALEPGWGEVLRSTDESGVVRWHFPEAAAGGGRGGGSADVQAGLRGQRSGGAISAHGTGGSGSFGGRVAEGRTYHLPAASSFERTHNGSRGPIGSVLGKLVVDRLAFPWAESMVERTLRAAEARLRPNRLRWFRPEDVASGEFPVLDGDVWRRLGEGRTLLLVHGTFSRADGAFGALPPDFLAGLQTVYGDRIIAFDHPTVTVDPEANVQWFVDQLPPEARLQLDVLAHSRGGLLARSLARRGTDEGPLSVGRVVMVGSPNDGTALANPAHLNKLLDIFTNLASMLDTTEVVSMILQVVQRVAGGAIEDLAGLEAMAPGSEYLAGISEVGAARGADFFALASDVSTRKDGGLLDNLLHKLVADVLPGGNDLVVAAGSGMGEASHLGLSEAATLSGDMAVSHTQYFESPLVRDRITQWLLREGAHVELAPLSGVAAPPVGEVAAPPVPDVELPPVAEAEPPPVADIELSPVAEVEQAAPVRDQPTGPSAPDPVPVVFPLSSSELRPASSSPAASPGQSIPLPARPENSESSSAASGANGPRQPLGRPDRWPTELLRPPPPPTLRRRRLERDA